MKLWKHPTRSLQSLQRFKTIISIITIQQAIKIHNSTIDPTCDTIIFITLGVTILRLIFKLCKKVMRNSSKSISNHGGEDENKDFKISTKVEMNSKGRDIVEQGFL